MLVIQKTGLPRCVAAALGLVALTFLSAEALALSAKETDYKDWRVRCEKADEKSAEQCVMFQNVTASNAETRLLSVAIRYPTPGEPPVAYITAPLGVYLPNGMSVVIDGDEPLRLPFEFCNQVGCHTRLKIEDKLLGSLKKGQKIDFSVVQFPSGQKYDGTASLNGFTAALGALK